MVIVLGSGAFAEQLGKLISDISARAQATILNALSQVIEVTSQGLQLPTESISLASEAYYHELGVL